MILPKTRHLLRQWKSIPLLKLTQGSSLSIQSNLRQSTNIFVQSGWRDEGHLELKQVVAKEGPDSNLCDVMVNYDADKRTSLGRTEGHISIVLQDIHPMEHTPTDSKFSLGIIASTAPTKPIERFMLDDGTVLSEWPPESTDSDSTSLRQVDYNDGVAHLTAGDGDSHPIPSIDLILQVPEKLNLDISLPVGGGSIEVQGKVEGDCSLSTVSGNVHVQKLRGHSIQLSASDTIYAKELLEAQNLRITTSGRVRAKQIHGRSVRVDVDKGVSTTDDVIISDSALDFDDEGSLIDIGSLFISGDGGATLAVTGQHFQPRKRAMRVKSHHGPLQATVTGVLPASEYSISRDDGSLYPLVELGGVNGSCQVAIEGASLSNSDFADENASPWIACQCHVDSLSDESVSLLSVDAGDIELTLDRKVESDLRLVSLASDDSRNEVAALLADEEDDDLLESVLSNLDSDNDCSLPTDKIFIETSAYSSKNLLNTNALHYETGCVENKSNEPDSRFEMKRQGSVGKIRIATAADHALHGFSSDKSDDVAGLGRPLMAAVTTGCIRVETLSWIGAIARRYGLEEEGRELGRTSGRHGRKIVPRPNE